MVTNEPALHRCGERPFRHVTFDRWVSFFVVGMLSYVLPAASWFHPCFTRAVCSLSRGRIGSLAVANSGSQYNWRRTYIFISSRTKSIDTRERLSAPSDQRILHVAIAGLPNAGKSTLVSHMVGDKVSAVSPKRHTTRRNAMGVMTVGNCQIFFHDTPGFVSHRDRSDYQRELSKASRETIDLVDLTLLVVDASKRIDDRIYVSIAGLLERALRSRGGLALVLNKVDLVDKSVRLVHKKDEVMDLVQRIADHISAGEKREREETTAVLALESEENKGERRRKIEGTGKAGQETVIAKKRDGRAERAVDRYVRIFMVSALSGLGVEDIVKMLGQTARPGPWRFDRDKTSNLDEGRRASEIVRESLFTHLYKELPYIIEQHTNKFVRNRDNSVYLDQDLRLERESQKGIVVGKLHAIHKDVEQQLNKLFDAPVKIHFNVVATKKRQR